MKSKTKLNALIIMCLAIICFVSLGFIPTVVKAETSAFKGDGSMTSPYLIEDIEDFKTLAQEVNDGNSYYNKYIKLTSDIDLNNEEWTPIGNSTNKFKGCFDGNDKTISNLVITGNNSNVGLFGFTTDGEIKSLTVNNACVSGYLNVGVVAGTPYTSKYTDITVSGHIEVNGFSYVGGVGGKNAYANWTNVTVDADETSYVYADSVSGATKYRTYVGGVIGFMGEGGHTLKDISSNIKVQGTVCDIGGIVGIAHYNNNFENVTFTGSVVAPEDAEEVGAIAGVWHNEKGKTVTFNSCESTGSVTIGNETTTGSIIGGAYNSSNETFDTSGSLMIDGKETWIKSCKINDVGYVTLEEAIKNAEIGDEIVLLKDVDETISIAGVTINANGFNAQNITVEPLQIGSVIVERNTEDNATVVTITYLNCDKDTIIVIPDGKDGLNGTNGKDGVDGAPGKDGADGKDGVDGAPGKDGADGKDGVDGKNANNVLNIVGVVLGGLSLVGYVILLVFIIKKKYN